jgi:hypothetical protein
VALGTAAVAGSHDWRTKMICRGPSSLFGQIAAYAFSEAPYGD